MTGSSGEAGQAALLMLGLLAALLLGVLVLFGFGQALGARGHTQRAADLAAVSAAQVMRRNFSRLFEPAALEGGVPNPRHLSNGAYLALARAAALRGAVRNGLEGRGVEVTFPRSRFAPTRVTVAISESADLRLPDDRRDRVEVRARATAEIAAAPDGLAMPGQASGGGYSGPLAYRQGKPMRPDVALAFDRMEAAARADGVALLINSGFRSDAEQAILFARHPDPKWVARPGTSLHRNGTELDLGPPAAYGWLKANAGRFTSFSGTNGKPGITSVLSSQLSPDVS
jgi:D-alanyl-D-alanine carboxypeptidase/Putative Flp pilus-assembly TadE/G-like